VSKSMAPKEYLDIENACVKACNNDLSAPKEKHMKTLLMACGGGGNNNNYNGGGLDNRVSVQDITYVLNAITRIISKATGWISMLKSHVVLHRLFQECGGRFQSEFFHHVESLRNARSGGKEQELFSLRYWKDDSSTMTFELSGWVRAYALYFEEFTCAAKVWPFLCSSGSGSTPMQSYSFDALLQHVPVSQTLMRRLTDCEPVGEILQRNDVPVRAATALMFKDSLKVFKLANEGVCTLVGLFFEQDKSKARKALDVYKRSLIQHEDLQRFYHTCQKMQIVNQAPALEAPPASFLGTMQEYVDTAKAGEMPAGVGPRRSTARSSQSSQQQSPTPSAQSTTQSAPAPPRSNANATLDALFGEMNIQTPPQNREVTSSFGGGGGGGGGNFLPSPSNGNSDPFGLATISAANGNNNRSNAVSTSQPQQQQRQLSPPPQQLQLPPLQQQPQQPQQQQQQRQVSNNPFGDDLFGTPKKSSYPVDLNSLYEQANMRQSMPQQQQQQPFGMPPQMMGNMQQEQNNNYSPNRMMGAGPAYQPQQFQQQQQQQPGFYNQQTSPPHQQQYPPNAYAQQQHQVYGTPPLQQQQPYYYQGQQQQQQQQQQNQQQQKNGSSNSPNFLL